MDTAGQLSRFGICLALGMLGGVLYELISLIVFPKTGKVKNVLRCLADVLFFLAFAALCIFVLGSLRFPAFREYYYLAFALGLIIYLKTFHKAVAFLKNICYNGVRKMVNCVKKRKIFRKKGEKQT